MSILCQQNQIMTYTIKTVVRHKKDPMAFCNINIRIVLDGKDRLFPTGKIVESCYFDNNSGKALKGATSMTNINAYLTAIRKDIDDFLYDLQREGKKVTMDHFVKFFNNEDTKSFIDFCYKECEAHKPIWKKGHYNTTKYQIDKLKEYKPDLCFSDLKFSFLNEYKRHLLVKKKNEINTVNSDFRTMRKFINLAIKAELMKESLFKHFKIPKEDSEIEYLTLDEVKKLNLLYNRRTLSDKLQSTCFYFLLSCYTGLRLADIAKDINSYIIENKRFRINTGKTKKEVYFDLSEPVIDLLNSPDAFLKPLKQSNSRINDDIEEICQKIGVTKDITFHCARHSFAINSLVLGIDLFNVSQILGHRDIKTTMIYAKITEALLNNQMNKWNAFSKAELAKEE